ncbi:MAG TPA: hypothetical protein VGG57_08650 [Stellaceae bacterium]|jgi:hypothetical protein
MPERSLAAPRATKAALQRGCPSAPADPGRHSYSVAGLSLSSELELPGLIGTAPVSAPDVVICQRPVLPVIEDAAAVGPTWQIAGDRFWLRIPGIARFLLTGGREIAVEVEGGTSADEVAPFLVGTVFGILLHQRNHIALHASAVEVNGKAVLFCGASGAGKSTISAALTGRGYPLIADDLCGITLAGTPMAHPDGRLLRLWEQTIEGLGLGASRGAPVRRRLQKYYVEPGNWATSGLPIGAVYALREARPPRLPGIERPNAIDAALLLRRNAYRPMLVARTGQRAEYFKAAAVIAGSAAGVFYLTWPLDFAAIPDVLGWLEDHWAEIGLRGRAT